MKTVVARDIMIALEEYPHIPYWFTIRQALAELEKADIAVSRGRRSLPRVVLVFNESYQLLGMVRRRDLLGALDLESLPAAGGPLRLFRRRGEGTLDAATLERLRERAERPVSEAMTPVPATLAADEPLLAVARKLVEHDISLLPVVEGGTVVGVVRTVEVLHEIAALLGSA